MSSSASAQVTNKRHGRTSLWLPALICLLLIAVEIYALFFDLGQAELRPNGNRPVIATYQHGVNEVRRRTAGTIAWNVPSAGAELRREDAILTMTNSSASIAFTDGSELSVDSDSLVVLERLDGGSRTGKIVLKLLEGTLSKKTPGTMPVAIDLADGRNAAGLIEDSSGSAIFTLRRTRNGVSIEVEQGNLVIGGAGGQKRISRLQQAQITERGVDVSDVLAHFSELGPDNGRRVGRDDEDTAVELRWSQTAAEQGERPAEVKVLVSRSPDMSDAKEADYKKPGLAQVDAPEDGAYYWQLSQPDGLARSRIASFSVVTRKAPKPETPDHDETIIAGQPVTFRWQPPAASALVYIETSSDRDFASSDRLRGLRNDTSIEAVFNEPRTIYWRLRADYGDGIGESRPDEARKLVIKPKPRLKAPRKLRSRIRLQSDSGLRIGPNWMSTISGTKKAPIDSAQQKQPRVTVELEWENVDGAAEYHLLVANDPGFNELLVDSRVRKPRYQFRAKQTERRRSLYFKVASVDDTGLQGPFSHVEEVELAPLSSRDARLAGTDSDPHMLTPEEQARRGRFQLAFSLGAAYHSRTFKSDTRPNEAVGSAMIPAFASIEVRRRLSPPSELRDDEGELAISFLASVLAEKAEPTTKNVIVESYPVPLLRASAMLEKPIWGNYGGAGLYAATSQRFSWTGRRANNERVLVLGLTGMLTSSQALPRSLHWRGQLALVAAGAMGADACASLRSYFFKSVRAIDHSGLFFETELMLRMLNVETSFGGIFKLGYTL